MIKFANWLNYFLTWFVIVNSFCINGLDIKRSTTCVQLIYTTIVDYYYYCYYYTRCCWTKNTCKLVLEDKFTSTCPCPRTPGHCPWITKYSKIVREFSFCIQSVMYDHMKSIKLVTASLPPCMRIRQIMSYLPMSDAIYWLKANRKLGVINRTITNKSRYILLNLYKSIVRPHLEYCTAAWSPHYIKDKDLLERIQTRFTRMIPELRIKLVDIGRKTGTCWSDRGVQYDAWFIGCKIWIIFLSWTTINVQEVTPLTRANWPRNGSEQIYVNISLLKELLLTCGTVLMNKLLVLAVSTVLNAIFNDSGVTMKMGLSWYTCVRWP